MRTERLPKLTLVSGSGGVEANGPASTPFGPLRAGLITTQTTPNQRLTELLNCLESEVAILESRYLEVCDTLIDVTQRLVRLGSFISDTIGTDVVE